MIEDDPITIPLNNGLVTWISQEDADIAGMGWRHKSAGKDRRPAYYAIVQYTIAGVKVDTYLHNLIWERMMGTEVPHGFLIDHINGDKLDNRRSNLRLATRSDNEANKKKRRSKTTSKYKGVTKIRDGRKKCWRCCLTTESKQVNLGTYYSEEEAARAYNKAALEQWGEFACLNDVEENTNEETQTKYEKWKRQD